MFDLTKRADGRTLASPSAARDLGTLARRLADAAVLPWLVVASALAVFGASVSVVVGWRVTGELNEPDRAGSAINLVGLCLALLLSFGVGWFLPAWWRRITGAAALLPALLLTATSGNSHAAVTALVVIAPAAWLGRTVAARLLGPTDRLTAWLVGSTLGFGFVAGFGFLVGSFGLLRPALIWPTLLATTVALALTARQGLRDDLRQLAAWLRRPARRDRLTFLLVGIGLALLWYNTIGALSPETASDTVRLRLPTALHFAQTRHLAADNLALLTIIQTPAAGEIANAVILSVGPLQTVKLAVLLQGVACSLAIFALGRQLHSAQAGAVAAFTFYSMPLVTWLSQTAYLDLLTSLLATVAALIIVTRAVPDWRAAVAVGILSGIGVVVKLHFGYVAIGLAVILGVRCLGERSPLTTLRLGATMALVAALTAAPWLVRSALISGQIPGFALATGSLTRAADAQPAVMGDLTRFGFGRSLGHLLRSLLDMTLFSAQFEWIPLRYAPSGLIGFLLLGLLPIALITPPTRRCALALLAGGTVAFLIWFYTVPYLRYGLPILALLCPLAGTAFAAIQGYTKSRIRRVGYHWLLVVLIACGIALQVQVPAVSRSTVIGLQDTRQFLLQNLSCCARYGAVDLLAAESGVTRVYSNEQLARLYITAWLSTPWDDGVDVAVASDESALLRALDQGGYSHLIIARNRQGPGWDTGPLADEQFLRRNTLLIGGQKNVYLYRLLAPDQRAAGRAWTIGSEILPAPDAPGGLSGGRIGSAESRIATAPITPGRGYLLTHQTRADTTAEPGKAEFSLIWRDRAGEIVATTREIVPTSPREFHQFSTLGVAPADAAMVEVRVTSEEGAIWFTNLSLRALANGATQP